MDYFNVEDSGTLRPLINLLVGVVAMIIVAWFLVYSFGKNVICTGQSMQPILDTEDTVMVDRVSYDFFSPGRFDVIAFYTEKNETEEDSLVSIKRIIGLPGEKIQISDGYIYVDGKKLRDDRLTKYDLAGLASSPITLETGEYFVLGDNPSASEDSRFSSVGNILKENILGKVWIVASPFSKLKFVR